MTQHTIDHDDLLAHLDALHAICAHNIESASTRFGVGSWEYSMLGAVDFLWSQLGWLSQGEADSYISTIETVANRQRDIAHL